VDIVGSRYQETTAKGIEDYIFFLDFPIYLQSVEIQSANGVLGREGGVEECSVAPLRNKRVKTVWLSGKKDTNQRKIQSKAYN
jgi:hypothetical protein